jgi:hypothetical protein
VQYPLLGIYDEIMKILHQLGIIISNQVLFRCLVGNYPKLGKTISQSIRWASYAEQITSTGSARCSGYCKIPRKVLCPVDGS